jgi:NADH-quinone oxidoreductase subunit H
MPSWLIELLESVGLRLPPELGLLIWAVVVFACVAAVGMAAVVFMVLMERKVLAWLTQRKGPNRVGPAGLLQTVADGVKLLFKEDIMTPQQDKLLFTLGPVIFFLPVFVVYTLIPFTEGLQGIALPVGALLVFALSSISVLGMVLAGWASNNKYSLLGGLRSAAQAISYEIPLVMAVLGVVLFAGSMDLATIVQKQDMAIQIGQSATGAPQFFHLGILGNFWLVLTPLTFLIFLVSSIAEVNRIPFDLPEAESELVSGYNTEYSGMKFAMFFLAEYAALFAMSCLTVVLFFGGYNSPIPGLSPLVTSSLGLDAAIANALNLPSLAVLVRNLEMATWMVLKTYCFIFLAMWLRGTLPRLKPDQLMGFSWKFLIPLSLINVFVIGLQKWWVWLGAREALLPEGAPHYTPFFIGLWVVALVLFVGGFLWFAGKLFSNQLNARLQRS